MNRDTEQYRDIAIKSLAVLGLMTILALGSFLTLTALSYIPKMVRSVGTFVASTTPDVGTAVVNVTNTVTGGDLGLASNKTSFANGSAVTLSWDKSSSEKGGSYSLSYPCMSGVSVSYKGTALSCNVPFYLGPDTEQVSLTVNSTKVRTADVPFTLRFVKNGETRVSASDSATLSVTNTKIAATDEPAPVAPAKPPVQKTTSGGFFSYVVPNPVVAVQPSFYTTITSPGYTIPGVPSYANVFLPSITHPTYAATSPQWGTADLRPVILEFGILDANTRTIIPTRYMSRASKAGIRFAVENIGTKTSEPWVFNAALPTSPRFTYLPEFQPPLKPGERIEYTLSFDRVVNDNNTVLITVDPAGTLSEGTKANNTASVDFIAF